MLYTQGTQFQPRAPLLRRHQLPRFVFSNFADLLPIKILYRHSQFNNKQGSNPLSNLMQKATATLHIPIQSVSFFFYRAPLSTPLVIRLWSARYFGLRFAEFLGFLWVLSGKLLVGEQRLNPLVFRAQWIVWLESKWLSLEYRYWQYSISF